MLPLYTARCRHSNPSLAAPDRFTAGGEKTGLVRLEAERQKDMAIRFQPAGAGELGPPAQPSPPQAR